MLPHTGFRQTTQTGQSEWDPYHIPQSPDVRAIVRHIALGHRIMVIMRGAPGSGKTFLARSLLRQTIPDADPNNHICSADDLFTLPDGQYNYDPKRAREAHRDCLEKVRRLAVDNWSPIFVDNPNTKFWEMKPYFTLAMENHYIVRTLEPFTPWRRKAQELAQINKGDVSIVNILRMLLEFEPVVANRVVFTAPISYTEPMPQMRRFPEIKVNLNTAPLSEILQMHFYIQHKAKPAKAENNQTNDDAVQSSSKTRGVLMYD